MKSIFLPLIFLTFSAFAKDDPSLCPIDDKGKLLPSIGYETTEIKSSPEKDIYTLSPDSENPFGGVPMIWVAYKDEQGRIVKIESGGDKPSQKVINFMNKKKTQELAINSSVQGKVDKSFKIPTKESFQQALSKAEDLPLRFGGAVEMSHIGKSCFVTKISDRMFDQKSKRVLENAVFSDVKCDSIKNLYLKFQKEIVSCSEKAESHESELAAILSSSADISTVTSGAGGGGGAPIRSIASVVDDSAGIMPASSYLSTGPGSQSRVLKEKEMCDILLPKKSKASPASLSPAGTEAKIQ